MTKIIVRKIFRYDPSFEETMSRYQGYCLIAKNEVDPPIVKEAVDINFHKVALPIFHSPAKRGLETAQKISQILGTGRLVALNGLKEVCFSLEEMMSEKEFGQAGSNLVRQIFCDFFIADRLLETRLSIKKRLDKLLDYFRKLPEGEYLVISHSFLMKLLQIYLKENSLFDKPELIIKYFDCQNKTFQFGEGFEFELQGGRIR